MPVRRTPFGLENGSRLVSATQIEINFSRFLRQKNQNIFFSSEIWELIIFVRFTKIVLLKHGSIGSTYVHFGWFLAHWIYVLHTVDFDSISLVATKMNSKKDRNKTTEAKSLDLSINLFVTDEFECARSSRRWWWWCVRMKQFQVSKKQSEASERTNKKNLLWLTLIALQ